MIPNSKTYLENYNTKIHNSLQMYNITYSKTLYLEITLQFFHPPEQFRKSDLGVVCHEAIDV